MALYLERLGGRARVEGGLLGFPVDVLQCGSIGVDERSFDLNSNHGEGVADRRDHLRLRRYLPLESQRLGRRRDETPSSSSNTNDHG